MIVREIVDVSDVRLVVVFCSGCAVWLAQRELTALAYKNLESCNCGGCSGRRLAKKQLLVNTADSLSSVSMLLEDERVEEARETDESLMV